MFLCCAFATIVATYMRRTLSGFKAKLVARWGLGAASCLKCVFDVLAISSTNYTHWFWVILVQRRQPNQRRSQHTSYLSDGSEEKERNFLMPFRIYTSNERAGFCLSSQTEEAVLFGWLDYYFETYLGAL